MPGAWCLLPDFDMMRRSRQSAAAEFSSPQARHCGLRCTPQLHHLLGKTVVHTQASDQRGEPMPRISFAVSIAIMDPITPGTAPNTPASAQSGRAGWRWLGEPGTGSTVRGRSITVHLPFPAEDRSVNHRDAQLKRSVVDQVSRGEVV